MKNENNILLDKYYQYKQKTLEKSKLFTTKYNDFYKTLGENEKEALNRYKTIYYWDINMFLYNREEFYKSIDFNLVDVLNDIYKNKNEEKLSLETIKKDIFKKSIVLYEGIVSSIETIDKIFLKAPKINQKIIVYRGMELNEKNTYHKNFISKLHNLKVGENFVFDNYFSTSFDLNVSFGFSGSKFTNKKQNMCCLLKINIPKNAKLLYMDTEHVGFKSHSTKNSVSIWSEYEFLLPRSSLLKYKGKYETTGRIPYYAPKNFSEKKYHISSLDVLEFDFVGIDKNREVINDEKKIDLFKNIPYFPFKYQKYSFEKLIDKMNTHKKKKL